MRVLLYSILTVFFVGLPVYSREKDAREVLNNPQDDPVAELIVYLEEGIPTAAEWLRETDDPRAVPALIAALDQDNEYVISTVINTLEYIQDTSAKDKLISMLGYDSYDVRFAAVQYMGTLRVTEAVSPLIALIETEQDDVPKSRVIRSLGDIGDARALRCLVKVLKDTTEIDYVRENSAIALGKLGDRRAVRVLLEMVDSDIPRYVLIDALAASGEIAMKPLKKAARNGEYRSIAVPAIAQLADRRQVRFLVKNLECYEVFRALLRIGDRRAVKPLIEYLENRPGYYTDYTIRILGEIGDRRAVPVLIDYMQNTNNEVRYRNTAAVALGKIGDRRAVEPMLE
ncbi:hypothetical protein GF359_10270, partial [candidate division WOR-3 bacterium]|nr:hypothetical protein [candidate division WOR-3 bacterium]MBD3365585.1 hypothetical protein [candidate division WOR-3 bacterium]